MINTRKAPYDGVVYKIFENPKSFPLLKFIIKGGKIKEKRCMSTGRPPTPTRRAPGDLRASINWESSMFEENYF